MIDHPTALVRHHADLAGGENSAAFSLCHGYRYRLTWRWAPGPLMTVCMLNPSTADERKLDPTVRGLVTRAQKAMTSRQPDSAWAGDAPGAVQVVNLFAYRATEPRDMKMRADPVGPANDYYLAQAFADARAAGVPVICAWGAHGSHKGRADQVLAIAARERVALAAYGWNDDGSPRHPLYIAHHQPPRVWRP